MTRDRHQLSEREETVLDLVSEGKTNRMIALELGMSESTVRRHLETIYRKLDVANRAEAVAVYMRRKLSVEG
jgi:DNA-binding NarL/FixJ family response regulator